ncbi:MAG: hypothetical protein KAU62_16965 [Candidatus Heimdallarchaeota archaeon]|nr:hypothetical protein [Candidatus Heimdallarchaeota archaeon]MCK4612850.1 hypothetical protein [Candidatus Heimdallarchaeota archaeon]
MVLKIKQKNELIRKFKALKELYNYEFVEEESLFQILNQVAENMYNYTLANEYSSDHNKYENHILRTALKEEHNKSLSKLLLHKGSFL